LKVISFVKRWWNKRKETFGRGGGIKKRILCQKKRYFGKRRAVIKIQSLGSGRHNVSELKARKEAKGRRFFRKLG